MISSDVRRAIERAVAAAGLEPAEPGLRPTGTPGQYASTVAFAFGERPERVAARIVASLANTGLANTGLGNAAHIARAEVTGPGFITITVSPEDLADLPARIAAAGLACAASDALRGLTVPAPPPAPPLAAPSWEEARTALAAQLTARLAAAAGATVARWEGTERTGLTPHGDQFAVGGGDRVRSAAEGSGPLATGQRPETAGPGGSDMMAGFAIGPAGARIGGYGGQGGWGAGAPHAGSLSPREITVAAAVAFAGPDAVRFSLARAVPGRPVLIDPRKIARHVLDNPAYAVRYAHARAASGVRWAAGGGNGGQGGWPGGMGGGSPLCGKEAGAPHAGSPPSMEIRETTARPISLPLIGRAPGGYGGSPPREIAVLLDALSWLPERVATAARRGRPDEFARYLEELASATIVALISAGDPGSARSPGTDRLSLARAARTGLAAGLGLLEVSAPDRV